MNKEINILIVDDHPIFRRGLRNIIESERNMHVVGDVADGEDAVEFLKDHTADVVVLDLDMPRMNGLEFTQAVEKKNIPVEIIILTMHKEEQLFNRAMDLGVLGFVSKENAATEIAEGIRAVAKGKHYVCSMFSHFLIRRSDSQWTRPKQATGLDLLTVAERNVLKLIAKNMSSKEIAKQLLISPKTVDNHRTNICAKLNIHGSHALLRFLLENKSLL
jgi:two-component system, NarL family, response regulator DegU